ARILRAPKLTYRLPLGELVDELVHGANLAHQRVFDRLHSHTAHDAPDERGIRIELRLRKERLQVVPELDLALQLRAAVARQPADDFIHFFLRALLALGLLNVQRIDAREFDPIGPVLRHCYCSLARSPLVSRHPWPRRVPIISPWTATGPSALQAKPQA